jgi:hypothetical protein
VVEPGVGTLNAAIAANGGNKIYQLKAGQWYQLSAIIENVGYHLQIIGEVPAAGAIPATLQTNADAGGAVFPIMFDAKGDITLKNLYLVNADLTGVIGNEFLHESTESARVIINKCIIDPTSQNNAIVMVSGKNKLYFTDNLSIRMGHQLNPNDGHYFVTDNASGFGIDTMLVENNTFVSMGTNMHAGGFNKYVHNYINFNHNSIIMQKSQIDWSIWENEYYWTNNLMFDCQTQPWNTPWQPMPGADVSKPKPSLIYADTIPGEILPSVRTQFVEFNMHYRNPKFYTQINELNAKGKLDGKTLIYYMPILWPTDSAGICRETAMFMDDVSFPKWKYGSTFAEIDPQWAEPKIYTQSEKFVEWTNPATQIHAMGYASDLFPPASQWPQWHWDLDGDPSINTAWPAFNGVYSNPALLTASIEYLPLGDLNWFPAAKAVWQANKAAIEAHIKAGNEGRIAISGVDNTTLQNFDVQCFPNPFSDETTIRYTLVKPSRVELTVFNYVGQKIDCLTNELKSAGTHDVKWNGVGSAGNSLTNGVYFYTLKVDQTTTSGQIVISR